ncbi:hypothetical protein GCM10022419_001630 [Nonomuraea rosea]|uniref:Uncharacterized protein n=1 Tax=Nonomuraea rosea TaxID=638574 RepID=A0ABP6V443_9ACTN
MLLWTCHCDDIVYELRATGGQAFLWRTDPATEKGVETHRMSMRQGHANVAGPTRRTRPVATGASDRMMRRQPIATSPSCSGDSLRRDSASSRRHRTWVEVRLRRSVRVGPVAGRAVALRPVAAPGAWDVAYRFDGWAHGQATRTE